MSFKSTSSDKEKRVSFQLAPSQSMKSTASKFDLSEDDLVPNPLFLAHKQLMLGMLGEMRREAESAEVDEEETEKPTTSEAASKIEGILMKKKNGLFARLFGGAYVRRRVILDKTTKAIAWMQVGKDEYTMSTLLLQSFGVYRTGATTFKLERVVDNKTIKHQFQCKDSQSADEWTEHIKQCIAGGVALWS
eukprot:c52308_g1_i1.p1 GENE.c52308_g1_i1~~c52308_g1_i1.p1  ORF type:complete len:191 (+),score=41.99 c52308_g1_i1:52-624(+)